MSFRFLAGVACTAFLSGCTSLPTSTNALRDLQPPTVEVCSQRSVEDAAARLAQAWSKCYAGAGLKEITVMVGGVPSTLPVNAVAELTVESEVSEARRTISVVMLPARKIVLMADIHQTAQCPAKVEARSRSFTLWAVGAKLTEAWIDNPDAPGPAMSCR